MTTSGDGTVTVDSDNGRAKKNVEAILPMLPLQNALLFYGDSADRDPGLLHVRASLKGKLDHELLREAWAEVVRWHPSLRTSIHSVTGRDPMTVIWKSVDTPWRYRDVTDEIDLDAAIQDLLDSDLRQRLDLTSPPTMRMTLVRKTAESHELIWTCHHIFLDGWSSAIVLEDLLGVYRLLRRGEPAASTPADPLRQVYSAITRSPTGELEEWWRRHLAGYQGPSPLPAPESTTTSSQLDFALSEKTSGSLRALARRQGVTVNAIIQAAWALTLAGLQGEDDVVFGTTVSGRSIDVIGIDRVVGYVANVVPIRARLNNMPSVTDLMASLRDTQFEMQPFEHAAASSIQTWSEVPGHLPLFRTFLVVENFPVEAARDDGDELVMTGFRSGLTTAYPVTIAVTVGDRWSIHVEGSPAVDGRWVEGAGRSLKIVLETFTDDSQRTIKELLAVVPKPVPSLESSVPSSRDVLAALPTTPTQHRLLLIWERLLGMESIGIHDDYFDLGGTSLLALQLFAEIEEEFDERLPLRTLLAAPTVSTLARAIEIENPVLQWESLVPIVAVGGSGHIFCVHSGGGNALTYRDLARDLPDHPVYGLTALGLDGKQTPLETVPEMARHYIAEMRQVQPVGPYRLVGHCFGGSVCLEMAAQLEESGEKVELVTVVDSGLPLRAARASSIVGRAIRVLRAQGISGLVAAIKSHLMSLDDGRMWDGSAATDQDMADGLRRKVAQANQRAFARFEPRPVEAPVLLVQSSTEIRDAEGVYWHKDWAQFTDDFTMEVIEADHQRLMRRPEVSLVAEAIGVRLRS